MLTTLFVAASLLCQAPPLPEGTEVEYDKFRDSTMIRLDLDEFSTEADTLYPSIWMVHKGKEPMSSVFVTLSFQRWGKHWEYLENHDVFIMCGEQRLKIRNTNYISKFDTKDPDEPCSESIHVRMFMIELQRILELGRDLEVKIGNHEPITVGPKSRGQMLRFVKAVSSGEY
jgi:hypothetical protein